MKKIFSLFAAVLMAGSMMAADPVVLTFKDYPKSDGDSNGAFTTTSLIDSLTNASGFVTCSATTKAYPGRTNMGCKLGSSSATGDFTLALVTPAEFDSIVVRCASYSATEGSLSINGGTAIDLTDGGKSNKVLRDVKITPAGEVSTLSIATTVKRAFVKSITFYPHESAPVVTPVVLTGAATAEAINITTESTGTWYGNVLSEAFYLQYKGLMGMSDSVIVQALADQNEAELYTGNKSFAIADLTFNDAALTPGKYYFVAGGLLTDDDPASMYGYVNNGEPIVVEFTVADPVLSFTFAPGENGVVTVTPSVNDKHYVVIFSNDDLLETMSAYEPCTEEMLIANYVSSLNDLDEPESVVLSGVNDVDINEFAVSQHEVLYVALSSGTYSMIVVEVEKNGRYWTLAEGSGRYEGVTYTFELPDFVGTVVLGETGISVTGIEEDYYVCYMLDKATYDEFSAAYSDDDLMNMTLGSSLPDETFALYHTLGDVVLYADQEYFVDPELGGAGEYVVLVANVDMMTGKIGSHTVSYAVTLDAEGKKSTPTTINYWLVGPAAENGWDQTKAMPMPGDSIVRHLNAGTYEFKVLTQEASWTGALGFANLNAEASSANVFGSDNVVFELENEGDVTIKVVEGQIVVLGTFKEQVVADYYIKFAGNNWTWVGMTQAPSGVYMYEGVWGGTGANVNTQNNNNGAVWYPEANIFFGTLEMEELPVPAVGTVGYYVYIPDAEPAPMVAFLYDGTPTAVENVKAVKAVKVIENGQVVIIKNGVRYNAVGAKL